MQPLTQQELAGYAKRFDAIRRLRHPVESGKRHHQDLTALEKDGFITLDGTLYWVRDLFTYEERNKKGRTTWRWHEAELFDIERGTVRYLEFENDDGLEISVTEQALKMRELGTTIGTVRSIAAQEEGTLHYRGTPYYYEDHYKAYFLRSGDEQEVMLYEFESDDDQYITVEAWGEAADEYEVFHSLPVDEARIEVVALGS